MSHVSDYLYNRDSFESFHRGVILLKQFAVLSPNYARADETDGADEFRRRPNCATLNKGPDKPSSTDVHNFPLKPLLSIPFLILLGN